MDIPADLLKGSGSGKVIVPGKPADSLLMTRITDQSGLRMPPSGQRLTDGQVALIRSWIEQGAHVPASAANDYYLKEVEPILSVSCYGCHTGTEPSAQLNLAVKAMALKGGASGPAILPGNSKGSLLIHRLKGLDGKERMPLGGDPLSDQQIATISRWIDKGAEWPDSEAKVYKVPTHWAYVKPVRPPLPAVQDAKWVRNPIDRFVLARLEKEGLKPSPEASRETLIRRVSLDLIGLPPTPAEVDNFVADKSPDAYEKLVDRLLASPRYGERWATPWLDLAHYGDSDGWTTDRPRVAWPYRDWVIKALNENMPFDKFTIDQLAGDLLPNSTNDAKIATGFVRSSMLLTEAGTDPEENNWVAQIDRASTVGTVWLGSTLGCAECHNHKYDPFTQKQFYQMVAFFNNPLFVNDPPDDRTGFDGNPYGEAKLELPTPEQAKKRDEIKAKLKVLEEHLDATTPEFETRQAGWEKRLLASEKEWQSIRPVRVTSANGTSFSVEPDSSVLASGTNPDKDTYVVDLRSPVSEITGIRIEALTDASLPGGGPGRDYYGNFIVHEVNVEAGPSADRLSKVTFKQVSSDLAPPRVKEDPRFHIKQIWAVDDTRAIPKALVGTPGMPHRPRVQLVLIPEKPLQIGSGGLLRISIAQTSQFNGENIGHFRLSVTSASDPEEALGIPAGLRPVVNLPAAHRSAEQSKELTAYFRTVDSELAPVRTEIRDLGYQLIDLHIPSALVLSENPKVLHPTAYIRLRGSFMSKGDLVEADVPSFLGHLPSGAPPNRLGLAEWLVSKDNPLTARVVVNRFWEQIFGRGIVETTEDFGTQGSLPSHPELLDWLATEFMDNGWNMKAIQRLIVTSSTYRQSSVVTPELLKKDPVNMLLARGPRFRVPAEMIRDIALAASGLLSSKMYGPPVMPYQPEGLWGWFPGSRGTDVWKVSPGEDKYRRALYIFIRRSVRYPSLTVFDAPSREYCVARRPRSDTPLQALTTLNDPAFFEAAQAMGRRIIKEGGSTIRSRAIFGFRLVVSRRPTDEELKDLVGAYQRMHERLASNDKETQALVGKADPDLGAWTMMSNALLNLDETLTKE